MGESGLGAGENITAAAPKIPKHLHMRFPNLFCIIATAWEAIWKSSQLDKKPRLHSHAALLTTEWRERGSSNSAWFSAYSVSLMCWVGDVNIQCLNRQTSLWPRARCILAKSSHCLAAFSSTLCIYYCFIKEQGAEFEFATFCPGESLQLFHSDLLANLMCAVHQFRNLFLLQKYAKYALLSTDAAQVWYLGVLQCELWFTISFASTLAFPGIIVAPFPFSSKLAWGK